MVAQFLQFFEVHKVWLVGLTTLSLACFAGSLLALPWLVARAPTDYFVRPRKPRHGGSLVRLVVRNVLGACLLGLGLLMLVLPGQGLLTIVVSLTLLDFRGKHRLVRRLVARPGVAAALQWLRARTRRPPFDLG